MSGVQPSANDNGVVEAVFAIGIGLIIIGVSVYLWGGRGVSDVVLATLGLGGAIALMGSIGFVSRLSDLETRNPIVIIRADLNDWETIRFDLIKLGLSMAVFAGVYEFVLWTPSNEFPSLVALPSDAPVLAAALVGVVVFSVLSIMFRSYKGGVRRKGRI